MKRSLLQWLLLRPPALFYSRRVSLLHAVGDRAKRRVRQLVKIEQLRLRQARQLLDVVVQWHGRGERRAPDRAEIAAHKCCAPVHELTAAPAVYGP